MNNKTKQVLLILGTVLIGVIFISAYASFNNNNISNSSSSTIVNAQTFPAFGSSNAVISNYSDVVNVTFLGSSNETINKTDAVLSNLEANDIIDNYIYLNNRYEVILANISAYNFRELLYNQTNDSNSINVGSTAYVKLPTTVTLYYAGTPVSLYLANKNYSIYINNIRSIGSTVNVKIFALLTRNGSIYNNQLSINYSS